MKAIAGLGPYIISDDLSRTGMKERKHSILELQIMPCAERLLQALCHDRAESWVI